MFALKIVLAYLWGIPWALLGCLLCVTVIGIPLGMVCFAIAGYPLGRIQRTAVLKHVDYEFGEGAIAQTHEGEVPWVL
jgi:uncharacterized membrane protein YccF (DUF307 family)